MALASIANAVPTTPESDQAWQAVLEQAAGPGTRFPSQEDAIKAIRAHLEKQESTLRSFLRSFPDDPRHHSASIRLAGVLAAKGRLLKQPELRAEARRILASIEDDATLPLAMKADARFARISQSMEDLGGRTDDAARDTLMAAIRGYDTAYPVDRRTAGLLVEIATLYDSDPARKKNPTRRGVHPRDGRGSEATH